MGHDGKVNCTVRTLFLRTAGILLPLLLSTVLCAQSGAIDTAAVPEGFRPYVHLLGSAEVIAPPDGPDWRSMEIKDYDQDQKKYRELGYGPGRLAQRADHHGDARHPAPHLPLRHRIRAVRHLAGPPPAGQGQTRPKPRRTARRSGRTRRRRSRTTPEEDEVSLTFGAESDGPDTLFMPDVDCWIAMQEQDGYTRTDSLDSEGNRMLLRDPEFEDEMGMKAAFLLVHLLDRQNPGMLDFADDYAKAIKLPYWRTIKMFSRLTGYRLNRSYDPEGADGSIEHIIRKHGLDRLDPPCSPE